jgi:uncharacterized protein (TIGR02588 family)
MNNSNPDHSASNDSDNSTLPRKNALEWLVFAVSLVLLAGTLGYLIFSAAAYKKSPPILSISLGQVQPVAARFRVPVTVSNDGNQTASGVQIEVTLNEGRPNEEKANFTVPYLPRHSQREGAALFNSDPRAGILKARVLGYVNP